MKIIYYIFATIIFTISIQSCIKNHPLDQTDECTEYKSNSLDEAWTVELEDYYKYKNIPWIDMKNDIAFYSHSKYDDVLQLFDKETGTLKSLFFIDLYTNGKIFTHNDLFLYSQSSDIIICNPSTKKITEIETDGNLSNKISLTGNKVLFAISPYVDTVDYIIMMDIESIKFDTILQEKHSQNGDYYKFKNPYLYVSSDGDSILYYIYHENYVSSPYTLVAYDLKTGKTNKLYNSKIYTSHIIQNNDDLYVFDNTYLKKLDPKTLKSQWKAKFENIDSYRIPNYYFIDENIVIFDNYDASSINRNTGIVNWKKHLTFATLNDYYDVDKVILLGDYLYVIYDNKFKTINIQTGETSGFYCDIPKEFNTNSMYSDLDNLYSISFGKELTKYSLK